MTIQDARRLFEESVEKHGGVLGSPARQYSHRNGETEPPTVEGYFWLYEEGLDGYVVRVIWQAEIRYRGKVDIRAGWIISGGIDHYVDELTNAQWWGPIMPPREQQ